MTAQQISMPLFGTIEPPRQPEQRQPEQYQAERTPPDTTPSTEPRFAPATANQQPAQHLQKALHQCHQSLQQDGRIRAAEAATMLNNLALLKIEFETKGQAHHRLFLTAPSQPAQTAAQILQQTLLEKGMPPINAPDKVIEQCLHQLSLVEITATHPLLLERARRQLDQDLLDGKMGRIATLPQVADFMVKMLQPQPQHRVLDPACGAGVFLSHLNAHLRAIRPEEQHQGQNLTGIEIYGPLAAAAQQALQIHQAPRAVIHRADTLHPDFADIVEPASYDYVISNLPLGMKTNAAKSGPLRLDQFDILAGRPGGKTSKAQIDTEILFIERALQALKPGTGEAALVVSDGLLSNQAQQYARTWIMQHFALNAVISLPQRQSKTSIMLLRRLAPAETVPGSHPILMGIVENTGEDRGKSTFKATVQHEGGDRRHLLRQSELIDYQVTQQQDPQTGEWLDIAQEPVPGENVLKSWIHFLLDPNQFFTRSQP